MGSRVFESLKNVEVVLVRHRRVRAPVRAQLGSEATTALRKVVVGYSRQDSRGRNSSVPCMQDIVPSGNTHSDTCVVSPVTSRMYAVQGRHVGGGSQRTLLLCPARGKRGTRCVPHRHSFEALSTHSKWPIKQDLRACSGLTEYTA